MDTPIYEAGFLPATPELVQGVLEGTPWRDRTEARRECFMSKGGSLSYTYGRGRGVRTYTSVPYTKEVRDVLEHVNGVVLAFGWGDMNGCFLNCYDHDRMHLGWHAYDFLKMDHTAPVVVVSFGEEREIWWRLNGDRGETPPDRKRLLGNGSMFIMPPGFQHTHEHRIPKGSHSMGPRVSMTFRRFLENSLTAPMAIA